ncbi:MAG: tetratricopeptide repeat protein, partial [Planctomycetes bacterium]|nr:tetratricopeptide repeat protein [Planctomycetota bacterium]
TGELGRGGMGVVYRAWQADLRREVALKALNTGATDEHEIARFYNEARLAARLVHPFIVPIYDVGLHEITHYFTMELVEGPTLIEVLHPDQLELPRLLALLRDIALGVQYAHDQGVIHRDLKPQNILLDALGKPRITDFGLARELRSHDRLTLSGTIMGTPSYMSPEQANGDRENVGPKSDVYALGAILYHGLCGRPPHEGDSMVETVYKVIDREPVPVRRINPKVPVDVVTICTKALEKDPARRYQSAALFADDIRRYLEGEPILARPTGTVYRVFKRLSKHRALTAVSIASAVLLAGGGASFLRSELAHRAESAARREVEADLERRREEAKKIYDRAVHLKPRDAVDMVTKAIGVCPEYAEAWFLRGLKRREIGEFEAAVDDFGAALNRNPGFTNAYLFRALVYDENLDRKELARADYEQIIRIDPESAIGYRVLGKSLAGQHKHEEAVAQYARAVEKDPHMTEAFIDRATSLRELRRLDAALSDVLRALETDPGCAAAWVERGRIHEDLHRLRDAVGDYTQALKRQPMYPDALCARGYARANLGDLDAAAADFSAALGMQRGNASALGGLGYVLLKQEKFDEAVKFIDQALQLAPKDAAHWNNRGLLLKKREDRKGAIAAFTQAIELDPGYEHARKNRANVLFDETRYAEAAADLDRVLAINPQAAGAYHLRGAATLWLKRYAASIRDWEKFLELSPGDRYRNDAYGGIGTCKMYLAARGKPVVTARDHLEKAKKLEEAGDRAGAEAACRAAAEQNVQLYTPYVTLARLAAGDGRTDAAVEALVAAIGRGLQDFEALEKDAALIPALEHERVRALRR